jgi:hypothetical protein
MNFTSRNSGYTRPAHETCSEGEASSEESRQLSCSPLTSDASEEMNPPMRMGSRKNAAKTSRTERLGNQMVLVERAPGPLPSSQIIPLRPAPRHHHPMSSAPVLWTPVHIPAAPRLGKIPVVRDLDQYILVTSGNYERMSNAVLQQALQAIQAPANLRTKPKALQYLKSYFLAIRDQSHVIYVNKLDSV